MKTATEHYVELRHLPHFGCKAVPIMKNHCLREVDGVLERKCVLVECEHGGGFIWINRSHLKHYELDDK